MARKVGYRWHLRRLMAEKDMYATTQLRPLLAERGVALSREQVYRLVTGVPERLSLATLAALCDILGCGPGDLVEPVTITAADGKPAAPPPGSAAAAGPGPGRPARRAGRAVARCPAGHEVSSPRRGCLRCRRDQVVDMAAAAEGSLPRPVIEAAVEAVAPAGQALRQLTLALAADPGALVLRGSAGCRAAGGRADRPRVGHAGHPGVRGLRAGRQAAVPRRRRRGVPAVPHLAAGCGVRQLRPGPPGRWPGQLWPAGLRGLPPPGRPAAPPPVRPMREDRPGRGASP